jgi:hypothetical protein
VGVFLGRHLVSATIIEMDTTHNYLTGYKCLRRTWPVLSHGHEIVSIAPLKQVGGTALVGTHSTSTHLHVSSNVCKINHCLLIPKYMHICPARPLQGLVALQAPRPPHHVVCIGYISTTTPASRTTDDARGLVVAGRPAGRP